MAWTVTARISYDDDKTGVTTRVTQAMQDVGFSSAGTGLWQCICTNEISMRRAVRAATGHLSFLADGVTLDHLFLTVVKLQDGA